MLMCTTSYEGMFRYLSLLGLFPYLWRSAGESIASITRACILITLMIGPLSATGLPSSCSLSTCTGTSSTRSSHLSRTSRVYTSNSITTCTTSTPRPPQSSLRLTGPDSSIRFIKPSSLVSSVSEPLSAALSGDGSDQPPSGTVKSIIPCTPLAIVKCLEYVSVYNTLLPYGDRAYGKTITVINRYAYARYPFRIRISHLGLQFRGGRTTTCSTTLQRRRSSVLGRHRLHPGSSSS